MVNTYIDQGDGTTILRITGLTIDGDILVDTADVSLLKKHSWHIKSTTNTNPKGYVAAKISSKTTKLHRFLMEATERLELVDHEDRNPWNNKRNNLRLVNHSQNNRNITKQKNNTSGVTGLYFAKEGLKCKPGWVAQLRVNGKVHMKRFSVNKHGEVEARKLAEAHLRSLQKLYSNF